MTVSDALLRFRKDCRAAAAAEMALVLPFLLVIMFGSVELGKFFLDAHVVSKSVRDGARFAARQPFTEFPGCSPSSALVTNTRNLTRTGQIAGGGVARLSYWTNATTVTVSAACTTGTYQGIYAEVPIGAPVVTVSATVPYSPLLNNLGFTSVQLNINAQSRSPVGGS